MPRIRQKADVYRSNDFQRDLKVRMAYLGIQQHDLAQHLGLSDASVSMLVHCPDKLTVDRLRKIANYLQLEQESVLRLLGYPQKRKENTA